MFGANLRKLAEGYSSISDLSRQLGINRTQFNRYLSGESFPRPDVLARICAFFDVDARVLLEPVDQIDQTHDPISSPYFADFIGAGHRRVRGYVPKRLLSVFPPQLSLIMTCLSWRWCW